MRDADLPLYLDEALHLNLALNLHMPMLHRSTVTHLDWLPHNQDDVSHLGVIQASTQRIAAV